jgi:hypothetical protein
MMLALNINAGISPDKECPSIEKQAPSPIVACGPSWQSRRGQEREEKEFGEARIILIDGEKK